MESKAARIQQWLRDLRLPSLRSWSNIDVSSVSSQEHSEELQPSPKGLEDIVTPWNTDQQSTKKWKSSQNLSSVGGDKQSHNEWYQSRCSQEEMYHDCATEEGSASSLTPSHLSSADSTQSLYELYHLQHYFTRTMKLRQSQRMSPRLGRRLSTSDPDFQFYNDQQDVRYTPQRTSGIEIINTVHSRSKKKAIFHRTLTNSSTMMNVQERPKHKNSVRFRQFPFGRSKDTDILHNSARRRLPYPPQSRNNYYSLCAPQPIGQTKYQRIKPYPRENSIQSNSLSYKYPTMNDVYHSIHNSAAEKSVHYSQNFGKYQHLQRRIPEISIMSAENMYFHKTIRMSTLKRIKVIHQTERRLPVTQQDINYHYQV